MRENKRNLKEKSEIREVAPSPYVTVSAFVASTPPGLLSYTWPLEVKRRQVGLGHNFRCKYIVRAIDTDGYRTQK